VRKRLLILAALVVALVGASWTWTDNKAHATTCLHPTSGPYTAQCLHWPDASRPEPVGRYTGMQFDGHISGTQWATSLVRANNLWYNAGFHKVEQNTQDVNAGGACSVGLDITTWCAQDFNESCLGKAAGVWVGCTLDYVFSEWNPERTAYVPSPHIYGTLTKFDTAGIVDGNGQPWSWTTNRQDIAVCHELGHVYGLDHTLTSPTVQSCFHWVITDASSGDIANVPLSSDASVATTNHNHNDGSCGPGCGYGNYFPLATRPHVRVVTRRQLARIHRYQPGVTFVTLGNGAADTVGDLFGPSLYQAIGAGPYGWPAG